jgi:hypothetical protein
MRWFRHKKSFVPLDAIAFETLILKNLSFFSPKEWEADSTS